MTGVVRSFVTLPEEKSSQKFGSVNGYGYGWIASAQLVFPSS